MRGIKLRAYAQNSNVMVYQKDFNKWIEGFMMCVEFKPWEDDKTEFVAEHIWLENEGESHTIDNPPIYSSDDMVEIMQFTGLHDKHGKEIYEGDITTNELYKIEGLAFMVYYDNEKGMFKQRPFIFENNGKKLGNKDLTLQMDSVTNKEIIGNIYEHNHLLEVIKND